MVIFIVSQVKLYFTSIIFRLQLNMSALYSGGGGGGGGAGGAGGDQNFDYMFKILIIGNSSVGKTSFLFRYCDDR